MKQYIEKTTGRRVKAMQLEQLQAEVSYSLPSGLEYHMNGTIGFYGHPKTTALANPGDWFVECTETGYVEFMANEHFTPRFVESAQAGNPKTKTGFQITNVRDDKKLDRFIVTVSEGETKHHLSRHHDTKAWFFTHTGLGENPFIETSKVGDSTIVYLEEALKQFMNGKLEAAVAKANEPPPVSEERQRVVEFETAISEIIDKHMGKGLTILEMTSVLDLYAAKLRHDLIQYMQH